MMASSGHNQIVVIRSQRKTIQYDNKEFTYVHLASSDVEANEYAAVSDGPSLGNTALHLAVSNKQIEMIKTLLNKGSDFTLKNDNNETPLHIAFKLQWDVGVSLILQAFYTVCSRISKKIKRALVKSGYPIDSDMVVHEKFLENFRPLHFAVTFQLVDIIPILIENGIDIQAQDSNGVTALHCAVQNTQMGLVKSDYLHKSLSKIECCNKSSTFPENLIKIINLLLRCGCNINAADNFGRTPIFYLFDRLNYRADMHAKILLNTNFDVCVILVRKDIIQMLLSYKPDFQIKDKEGSTILHMMAKIGSELLQRTFEVDIFTEYSKTGGNLNALDNSGYTALHYACGNGYKELVTVLLNNGADVNFTRSKEVERPIHAALQFFLQSPHLTPKEQLHMIEELLDHGAYVDATMRDGTTPILLATNVQAFANNIPLITCLLKRGCDVNCADSQGKTPLHNICKLKYLRMIDDFMQHGADMNAVDHEGNAPFSIVLKRRNFGLVNSVDVYSYLKRLTVLGVPLCDAYKKLYETLAEKKGDLMKVAKSTLHPSSMWIEMNIYLKEFKQKLKMVPTEVQCRAELDAMKTVRVDDNTTLYDILHKNSKQMALYLRDENINILKDTTFDKTYPLYGYLVKNKMKITNRELLREPSRKLLMKLFQANVPDVFDLIIAHLRYDDLLHFLEASEPKKRDNETESKSTQDVKRQRLN